nr:helix-turn-helix domain-containing protein [Winogradskyella flava]
MDLEKEELYLKPNYTLNLLAKKLNTNSTYLSETVNKNLGMSFSTYTNKLRINNIVSKMQISKHLRNYTIEALAKEAGYKSVNSFNNNFKKLLKITPSQYLKEIRKKEN